MSRANPKSHAQAPAGQGVTFVELFFDLVFVFAITQVTGLVAHHLTLGGVLEGVLVFWMIWWGWTQFTWALNPADTNHGLVRVCTLLATAIAFPMAIAVGSAFADDGLLFSLPYVLIRLLGLGLFAWVTSENPEHQKSVRLFSLLSSLGLVAALAGGFAAPEIRPWFWLGAIAFDVIAAEVAGKREGWSLHAPHFAERHGLIVIIALGESLIAAGNGAAAQVLNFEMFKVLAGTVALICLLWWTYFGWLKDALEKRFEHAPKAGAFARDVYSLWHFPMVAGVIALAVSIEEMVAHPSEPMHAESLILFVVGIALFVGSGAAAYWRASRDVLWTRLITLVALAGVVSLLAHAAIVWVLLSGIAALSLVVAVEVGFSRTRTERKGD